MGRIVSTFFITLDGVVEAPDQWQGDRFDEAVGAAVGGDMDKQGAHILGRRLYDEWSAFWPEHPDDGWGRHINAVPKYVVSDSLTDAGWNDTTIVRGAGAVDRVRELKSSVDGDIGTFGSATTVRWLLSEGLVDELSLLVFPVAVGHGRRLFEDTPTYALDLVESTPLPTGVLHLRYAPAASEG
jgi:dihydrofolate reductase